MLAYKFRFFLILLLLSFLQSWKLAASTPGAEDFLKHIADEGTRLLDEVAGEEGSVNNQPPLNAAQTAAHTAEERASLETVSSGAHAIADTTSSSSSIETEEQPPTKVQRLGSLDDTIENLEEVSDVILALSEQKNRCLASAAVAMATNNVKIAKQFQAVVKTAEKSIDSYRQFSQKMKEGNVSAASRFRMKGFSLECKALGDECRAQVAINGESTENQKFLTTAEKVTYAVEYLEEVIKARAEDKDEIANALEQAVRYQIQAAQAVANGDSIKAENFSNASANASYITVVLEEVAKARSEGKGEAVKAYEQAVQYRFQIAQAAANGDNSKVKSLSTAADNVVHAAEQLKNAAQVRSEGQEEIAKTYEQVADYHMQAAQAAINEDSMKAKDFSSAANNLLHAVDPLKNVVRARNVNDEEVAKLFNQAADYHMQASQATAKGDSTKAMNFSSAAHSTISAAKEIEGAAIAKSEGQGEAAKTYEQAADYHMKAVQATIKGDSMKAKDFSNAANNLLCAIAPFKNAARAKSAGQDEAAKAYEKAASYHVQAAQLAANGDNTKAENFSKASWKTSDAGEPLKKAAQAKHDNKIEIAEAHEQEAEYYFQAAYFAINGDSTKVKDFSDAGAKAFHVAPKLEGVIQARSEGEGEVVKALEQAVQYQIQAAQAAADGNNSKAESLSSASNKAACAGGQLKNAVQAKHEGLSESGKALEKAAEYYFQAAQACARENNIEGKNFSTAALCAINAAEPLKNKAQARSEGYGEAAEAFEQSAQYHFQAAQAAASGESIKVKDFSSAARRASTATWSLKYASQARSEAKGEVAKAFEQVAHYHFQSAQAVANGENTKADYFTLAARTADRIAEPLKNAFQARNAGQEEAAKALEQSAQYYYQAAQFAANGDKKEEDNFSTAAYTVGYAAEPLKKAVRARCQGKIETAVAYEQAAQYYYQAAQAAVNGDKKEVDDFSKKAHTANSVAQK